MGAPHLQIEEVAPRHMKALARLFADIVANGDDATFHPHPLTEDQAAKICRTQGLDQYFIALSDGVAVAYGMLRGWEEGFAEPSLGVAIHPSRQGKGLGRRMTSYLIDAARHRGAKSVRLSVYSDNSAAVRLYAQLGFELTLASEGKLLGRLDLSRRPPSEHLTVGVCADVLIGWGGGRDLLVGMIKAMYAAEPGNRIILLSPTAAPAEPKLSWKGFRFAVKDALSALAGRPRSRLSTDAEKMRGVSDLVSRILEHIPTIEVGHSAGLRDGLAGAAENLRLDAVLLAMRKPRPRPRCAVVGYVPDYQHRHLPRLFSAKEIAGRDRAFEKLALDSDAMVMNARAVAEDMRRFTGGVLPELHALPFAPALNPEWLEDKAGVLEKYRASGPYFIVCNQFWMHKDHLTVFRAMAGLSARHGEVALICTGETNDYRNPGYFGQLTDEVRRLRLESRVRFLGHIPKRDQIELMKHSVALIQPTLFEGGPGGGATYEAVALGKRVLLSDIAVNREIDTGDVRLFPGGDHAALSALMGETLAETPGPGRPDALLAKSGARLSRNGEAIWGCVRSAIANRRRSLA
jgi:GNAT superfamily N-acetyltransferase